MSIKRKNCVGPPAGTVEKQAVQLETLWKEHLQQIAETCIALRWHKKIHSTLEREAGSSAGVEQINGRANGTRKAHLGRRG